MPPSPGRQGQWAALRRWLRNGRIRKHRGNDRCLSDLAASAAGRVQEIAILLIGAALLLPITSGGDRGDYIFSRVLFLVIPGVAAFLIGQAIRYVLVPPKKSNPLP